MKIFIQTLKIKLLGISAFFSIPAAMVWNMPDLDAESIHVAAVLTILSLLCFVSALEQQYQELDSRRQVYMLTVIASIAAIAGAAVGVIEGSAVGYCVATLQAAVAVFMLLNLRSVGAEK